MAGYWSSYDEVPQCILEMGCDGGKVKARDPKYLKYLNDVYNPWVQEQKKKSRRAQEKRFKLVERTPFQSCFVCGGEIEEEQLERVGRLCVVHEDQIRHLGSITAHGVELRYVVTN
jgi:hypothetical protein